MGSTPRKHKNLGALENKDLISSLPDDVLGRILSWLPTKYAVATTILSSRWKNLYKLASTLDFDDSISFNPRVRLGIGRRNNTCFKEIVNLMLARCKTSQISKFRMKCKNNYMPSLLHECMEAVVSHKVAELELSFHMSMSCLLKFSQLTCENLVLLKLDGIFTLCVPKSVTFPRLKVLFMKGITFYGRSWRSLIVNDEPIWDHYHSLNGILSGCPLLEELVIDGCTWHGGDLYFTNPLLRKLTLDPGLNGPLDQLNDATIYIDLPSLVYFDYSECLAQQYEIRNLNSIIEAHIITGFNDDEYEDGQDLCNTMLDFITGLRDCQFLDLSRQCLEALTSGYFELPVFRYLTRLDLALGHDVSWNDVLLDFLISSRCLKSLTLVQSTRCNVLTKK
ncbi:F-box/LRR-repeat protein At4g14103 isoform X2 [Beta vulgaris subsp. vulgaris]|uniref:F-box/LRR-repeat protein At4g14103 isoform X2 n=1 Tax=Beta vulgaris subsp. vulgaris TaxID=3555 RepID=UPI0020372C74|nr:F-box/LRR-repeat protein At4g14103 isoform X2 [Beta vulgaris subsp. vulgaris]